MDTLCRVLLMGDDQIVLGERGSLREGLLMNIDTLKCTWRRLRWLGRLVMSSLLSAEVLVAKLHSHILELLQGRGRLLRLVWRNTATVSVECDQVGVEVRW